MTPSSTEDSRELTALFDEVRLVASLKPNAIALLSASVDLMKRQLPKATLSPTEIAIAKHRGDDLDHVALLRGATDANATADKALMARMPKERVTSLQAFAGSTDVAAQARRARALGWDRDHPNYPAPTPIR